jgi:hypothetical protein
MTMGACKTSGVSTSSTLSCRLIQRSRECRTGDGSSPPASRPLARPAARNDDTMTRQATSVSEVRPTALDVNRPAPGEVEWSLPPSGALVYDSPPPGTFLAVPMFCLGMACSCCLSAGYGAPTFLPVPRWQELPKEPDRRRRSAMTNDKAPERRRRTLPTLVPRDEHPAVDPPEIIDKRFGTHAMLDREGYSVQDVLDGKVPGLDPDAMFERPGRRMTRSGARYLSHRP